MKLRKITKLFVLAFFALIVASSCVKEGPMGPGGLDGADGANGADGSDGTNGVDGNVTCLACHSKANMDAVNAEYETSTHGMSGMMYNGQTVYIYAGAGESRKDCAVCHTHEGFVETQFTGRDTLTAALDAPTRIGCETCHGGHVSFDFENDGQDYALRTTAPVELAIAADGDQPVNVSPTSNLCINSGATYNYKMIEEDRSMGMHNPDYILAILKNSIESLK